MQDMKGGNPMPIPLTACISMACAIRRAAATRDGADSRTDLSRRRWPQPSATAIRQPIVGPSDFGLSMLCSGDDRFLPLWKVQGQRDDQRYQKSCRIHWHVDREFSMATCPMKCATHNTRITTVMFPELIHVHQGDPRINTTENYFQVYIKDVQPNVVVNKIQVPEVAQTRNSIPSRWTREACGPCLAAKRRAYEQRARRVQGLRCGRRSAAERGAVAGGHGGSS